MKKGMIVFLFTGLAMVIIAVFVISKGSVEKKGFVGEESLRKFEGGMMSEKVYFYVDMVARNAAHSAIKRLGMESFGEECVERGYVLWYKEGCVVSSDLLKKRFLKLFEEEFLKKVKGEDGLMGTDFGFDVKGFDKVEWEYKFGEKDFRVIGKAKSKVEYAFKDNLYSMYPHFEEFVDYDFEDYLEIDDIVRKNIQCLLDDGDGDVDVSKCGLENASGFKWEVEKREVEGVKYMVFSVTTRDLSYVGNIEIGFAINLNNLDVDELKGVEEINF